MKRFAFYLGVAAGLVASCSIQEESFETSQQDDAIFYASFEQPTDVGTKVYANEDLLLRWTADDRVSIFNKNTYNQQYKFTGNTGANSGGFKKVETDEFMTGNSITDIVSVYPYQESTEVTEGETLSVTLPAEQHYAENTFGLGSNTMVSVSSDNLLQYKNVGGYLMLKLYGDGFSVSSITLKGNNGEKLAGKATVTMPLDGVPVTTMTNDATSEITLTCATPVRLGANAEESTPFWFVVPPVAFSKGITITVKDAFGGVFQKSTSKSISIERSRLIRMAPAVVIPDVTLSNYDYRIIHKDQYNRGKPKYYRVNPDDVEIEDQTDYNNFERGPLGIEVNKDGVLFGDGDGGLTRNPTSPVLDWAFHSSIDLLDYVETYAEQLSDVVSTAGINPEYRFFFAGFDEKGDIVINMTDNNPAKAPYISDDEDRVNQNQFVTLEGSVVSINLDYLGDGRLAIGHTPLIYIQSVFNGIILAECFIKLEIIDGTIIDPPPSRGYKVFIRHSAEFDYDDIPATGTYGENGIGRDFVAPNEMYNYDMDAYEPVRELNVNWDEMKEKILDKLGWGNGMSFEEFQLNYDVENPLILLAIDKDGRFVEPGDLPDEGVFESMMYTRLTTYSIGDLAAFYREGLTINKISPANWKQDSNIVDLTLDPRVSVGGPHFVYVVYPAFDNAMYDHVVIKFVYNVTM